MSPTERYEEFSVAMTETLDSELAAHLNRGPNQEDLLFGYWVPSRGRRRLTALLTGVQHPATDERHLHGNVAFESSYLRRVLEEAPIGVGIAFIHSHLTEGWQGMSDDDIIAERDRIASPAFGRTRLPLVGLTWGRAGFWSGRFWLRPGPFRFVRRETETVRVVGEGLRVSRHTKQGPTPAE